MGKLVYLMNVSLDGYINTPDGSLDWALVDEELHGWFNDRSRETEAFLYGRRLYEVMNDYWPTAETDVEATPTMLEFARIWNEKPKIVFSSTLESVAGNSRLLRSAADDDPGRLLDELRSEFDGELDVGGATLASAFIRRGLVDEYRLVIHPVVLGGGTPFFPELSSPISLRPTETRAFSNGARYVGYSAVR